jgi:hypothetical protein
MEISRMIYTYKVIHMLGQTVVDPEFGRGKFRGFFFRLVTVDFGIL